MNFKEHREGYMGGFGGGKGRKKGRFVVVSKMREKKTSLNVYLTMEENLVLILDWGEETAKLSTWSLLLYAEVIKALRFLCWVKVRT